MPDTLADLVVAFHADFSDAKMEPMQTALKEFGDTAKEVASTLETSLEAQVQALVDSGATLAEALAKVAEQAAATASPLTETGAAAGLAAEQMGLFGEEMQIPYADVTGQMNLFSGALEPIPGAAEEAGKALHDLGEEEQEVEHHSHEAHTALGEMSEQLMLLGEAFAVTEVMKEFGEEALHVYGEIERTSIALTALSGSASLTGITIEHLEELANKDALSMPSLLQAQQRMQAFHVAGSQIPALLEAAANSAKASGMEFQTVAQRLALMAQTGMAMPRVLGMLGLSIGQLGEAMGVTADQASKTFKALDETARVEALTKAFESLEGTAEKVAAGIEGQFQILKNQMEAIMVEVGRTIAPIIVGIMHLIEAVLPVIKEWIKDFQGLPEPIKNTVIAFGLMLAMIPPLIIAVGGFGLAIEALILGLEGFGIAFAGGTVAITGMAGAMIAAAPVVAGVAAAIAALGVTLGILYVTSKDTTVGVTGHLKDLNAEAQRTAAIAAAKLDESGFFGSIVALGNLFSKTTISAKGMNEEMMHTAAVTAGGFDVKRGPQIEPPDTDKLGAHYKEQAALIDNALHHRLAAIELEKIAVEEAKKEGTLSEQDYTDKMIALAYKKRDAEISAINQKQALDKKAGSDAALTEAQLEGKKQAARDKAVSEVARLNATLRENKKKEDDKEVDEYSKKLDKEHAYELKVYAEREKLDEELAADKIKTENMVDVAELTHITKSIERERAKAASDYSMGLISAEQRLAIDKSLDDKEETAQRASIAKEIANLDETDTKYLSKKQALNDKLTALDDSRASRQQKDLEQTMTVQARLDAAAVSGIGQVEVAWTKLQSKIKELEKTDLPGAEKAYANFIAQMERAGKIDKELQTAMTEDIRLREEMGKSTAHQVVQLEKVTMQLENQKTLAAGLGTIYVGLMKDFSKAFDHLSTGIVAGITQAKTWKQAWHETLKAIETDILNVIVGGLLKLAAAWLENAIFGKATGAALDESLVIGSAAAGGAAAAAAAAPEFWWDPEAAIAIGEAMSAAIVGGFGVTAAAAGGFEVGSEKMMTLLHPHEMVLPSDISTGLRGLIDSGTLGGVATAGAGGSPSITVDFSNAQFSGVTPNLVNDIGNQIVYKVRQLLGNNRKF